MDGSSLQLNPFKVLWDSYGTEWSACMTILENWSLVDGIFMEVIIRAQYFKQSSLSPVWRLYLPVLYVTMLELHGAECIHDEVV